LSEKPEEDIMVIWMAFFAMICWGVAPIFAKLGLNNVNPAVGLILRTMMAAGMVSAWAGFNSFNMELKTVPLMSWLLIAIEAILATVVGDLAYYVAIKDGDVAVVSIIMSVAPLVTMICAGIFLGEPITSWRVIGACYIIFGLILIM
jgi:transporter family protein